MQRGSSSTVVASAVVLYDMSCKSDSAWTSTYSTVPRAVAWLTVYRAPQVFEIFRIFHMFHANRDRKKLVVLRSFSATMLHQELILRQSDVSYQKVSRKIAISPNESRDSEMFKFLWKNNEWFWCEFRPNIPTSGITVEVEHLLNSHL